MFLVLLSEDHGEILVNMDHVFMVSQVGEGSRLHTVNNQHQSLYFEVDDNYHDIVARIMDPEED
jgi:hypothetical protein